jgi:hypothetical protein
MRSSIVVLALALLGLLAPAAQAIPPQPISVDPAPNIVRDNGEACGFPVEWAIDISSVEGHTFFNQDGIRTRQVVHIKEDNTITNLETGLTLREGPDSFTQTIIYDDLGRVERIIATGLAANVFGEGLKDVGRVVWLPGTNEIVFSAGSHPVREGAEFGNFRTALAAFCDVLAPA